MTYRRFGLFLLVCTFAACEPAPESPPAEVEARSEPASGEPAEVGPQPGPELLTPDGWGPLRIGMTLDEVVAAAGADANPEAVGGPVPGECDEFRPLQAPEGVLVMVENGILTRISITRDNGIVTPEGIRVGDPADRVLQAYGDRVQLEPHKYVDPPAAYLTVWREAATGEPRGIRYEVDADGRVNFLRGGASSIEYVEGCL